MANFKNTELLSVAQLTNILIVTFVLLSIAALFLWLLKKSRPDVFSRKKVENIHVLEVKSDVRLGTIAIIKVYDKTHLLIVSKSGTCICAIDATHVDPSMDEELHETQSDV